MQTQHTHKPQDATRPARKHLPLHNEAPRRLPPAELRLVAGGTGQAGYNTWRQNFGRTA
jgi:hypothetical protein